MNANSSGKHQVEAMYPVAGIQRGMIFHSLLAPQSGVYVLQDGLALSGEFDITSFWRAWQAVLVQHPVFRTLFVRLDTEKPVQVVLKYVELPRTELDWRALTAEEQAAAFLEFLREEQQRGFDFGKAPLMRVALIRRSESEYYFVWTRHHVLLDGWSGPLVMRDVMTCYAAYSRGREPALPPVRGYQDYVSWVAAQDHATARQFWKTYLDGIVERTPAPLAGTSELGARSVDELRAGSTLVAPALNAGLEALVRRERVTLNVLVQGAWALLLSRYGGGDEVLFGTTVAGRPPELPGVESIVGPFINSVPLRVRLPRSAGLGDWLRELQAAGATRAAHEYLPLVDIQAQSILGKRGSLFDTLLVFDNYPSGTGADTGTEDEDVGLHAERLSSFSYNNYPLTLMVMPGEQLLLQLKYDGKCYAPADIEQLLAHLQSLLAAMVAEPERPLRTLEPMDPAELQRVLLMAHAPRTNSVACSVVDLFSAACKASPERAALVCGEEVRSYAWLDQNSNRLAHCLLANGVVPEAKVGLLLGRSVHWIVGLLAILKAGAAYVPLAADWPDARIEEVLRDSAVEIVVTEQALLERVAGDGERNLVSVDRDWEEVQSFPAEPMGGLIAPERLAYVIYTSGSTGKPKGVCVSHGAIAAYVGGAMQRIELDATAELGALSTSAADLGYTALYGALCTGRTLRVLPESLALDAAALAAELRRRPLDMLKIVPSHLEALLASAPAEDLLPRQCLVLGGETPSAALLERVRASAPCRIVNHYGPTEATVGALAGVIAAGQSIAIGTAMDDRSAYVLDGELRCVPPGATGELYLGGAGLARGYWNDPRQTAQRFLPDALATTPGQRIYRTGDRARYCRDGRVQCLGRVDDQIKLRGHRVELGELEVFLRRQPGVVSAAVNLWRPETGAPRLVAYVVSNNYDNAALRAEVDRCLPEPMRPDDWVAMEVLPLTTNGKLDRRALPAPGSAAAAVQHVQPRPGLEQDLAAIWCDLLQRERVGIDDNFFALGGNSLLIIQAHGRLCKQVDQDVSVLDLFKFPTIRKLAEHLGGAPAVGIAFDDIQRRLEGQRGALAAERRLAEGAVNV